LGRPVSLGVPALFTTGNYVVTGPTGTTSRKRSGAAGSAAWYFKQQSGGSTTVTYANSGITQLIARPVNNPTGTITPVRYQRRGGGEQQRVSGDHQSSGITALSNGNYVVSSANDPRCGREWGSGNGTME
jgi:hypothetical protein